MEGYEGIRVGNKTNNNEQKGKMKTIKKMILCLALLAATTATFTGCRTAEGFGEDMEDAGESIQDKID